MPRDDPTDTGGLFIGRRPGTGPLKYRGSPERGGAGRRRADAALAAAVLVLVVLLCLTLWGPQPAAWLWVGSQVDYQTGSVSLGIAAAFGGVIGTLRDYSRQFEELSPEEISQQLRERRDAEKASALAEVPPLDLTTPAWHEPPDAEAVNAATYALRRSVNRYPDDGALREALAARHGVTPDQVAPGHGAGELLHAAFRAIGAAGGQVAIAWPGWGPLPRLVHEAGGVPVPGPPRDDGAPDTEALLDAVGPETAAVALCTPNDPTGAAVAPADLRALAERLDERVWLVVDAALAEFEPPQGGQTPLGAKHAPEGVRVPAGPKGGQTPLGV